MVWLILFTLIQGIKIKNAMKAISIGLFRRGFRSGLRFLLSKSFNNTFLQFLSRNIFVNINRNGLLIGFIMRAFLLKYYFPQNQTLFINHWLLRWLHYFFNLCPGTTLFFKKPAIFIYFTGYTLAKS